MDLFDLIDEEVLEEQAQQAAAATPLSAAAPAAAPPLSQPQAQPVQRHALPLLPHERACDAGGGFEAVGGRRADASTKTSYAPPPKQDMTVEKYSQLRIKSRVVSSVVVDERLRDLRVMRLSHVRGDVQGDWALLCVLGEKAGTKEASNGKRYGIWTLCDLEGTCTKLFLFGDAFAEHWKESEASILALLAPKVKAEGGAVTLTVDQPAQLFKLGTAADFALCKADRKDGRPCSMVVNARVCEFCPFHAGAALKAMGQNKGGRMELSGGNASFSLRKRMLAASAGAAGRGLFGIPMGSRGAGAHAAGGGVRAPPAAQRNSAEEMQRVAAGGFGKANSAGSRYLLNVAAPPQPPQPAAASTASGAARGVAAMVQAMGVQARMRLTGSSQRPQFVAGPQAQARAAVRLVETDIFDDDGDDAMAFARSLSRRIGGFQPPDPGGPRPKPSAPPPPPPAAARPSASAGAAAPAPPRAPLAPTAQRAPSSRAAAAAPPGARKRSFGDAFASVTAGVDSAQGSLHAALADEDTEAHMLKALDALARREGLTDAAAKVTKMDVTAWRCSCGALTERQRPDCTQQRHGGRSLTVVKRFFCCRSCKRRAYTLDSSYPSRNCAHCGGNDYDRTPLAGPGPRVNVHDGVACREALRPRGEEHSFALNSLR